MTPMTAESFQKHCEKMFPLVSHLGLQVQSFSPTLCELSGSWAVNKNHIGTVFGGSLYCFTALSCYGLFWSLLQDRGNFSDQIVIAEGQIKYLSPVEGDFLVRSKAPSSADLQLFFDTLERRGRARLLLQSEIYWQKKLCAQFSGSYIA